MSENHGTFRFQPGTMGKKAGTMSEKDGTMNEKDGTFRLKHGTMSKKDGTMNEKDGTTGLQGGTFRFSTENDVGAAPARAGRKSEAMLLFEEMGSGAGARGVKCETS